jgi:hypothetical protein
MKIKDVLIGAILCLFTTGLFFFNFKKDVIWPPWFYLSCLISVFLTIDIIMSKKVPRSMALLFGVIVLNGIAMFEWRPNTPIDSKALAFSLDQANSLRLLSAHATAEFLLLSMFFYFYWSKIRSFVGFGLMFGGLFNACSLILDQLILKIPSGADDIGLLGNRSAGASFTAVWIFLVLYFELNAWISVSLGVLTILISHSGISYLALISGFTALFIAKNRKHWPWIFGFFATGISLGSFVKPQWFQHISRYDAWPMFFQTYIKETNIFFGFGAGTFPYFGPYAQALNDFMTEWQDNHLLFRVIWTRAHNDWLQILIELGLVAFALSLLLYAQLLTKSLAKPRLFACLIAYGVTMIANYPIHIASGALLGFWLCFETIWGKNETILSEP